LTLTGASVSFIAAYDMLVFEQKVQGVAGRTKLRARGQMNGAPVVAGLRGKQTQSITLSFPLGSRETKE
jgi:hypothetical protein